jgi:hypothetical protein
MWTTFHPSDKLVQRPPVVVTADTPRYLHEVFSKHRSMISVIRLKRQEDLTIMVSGQTRRGSSDSSGSARLYMSIYAPAPRCSPAGSVNTSSSDTSLTSQSTVFHHLPLKWVYE